MNHTNNSTLKTIALLSMLSLGGCMALKKNPPAQPATLTDLKSELTLTEQRFQKALDQQHLLLSQQQADLATQLNSDIKQVQDAVSNAYSKISTLLNAMSIPGVTPEESCPPPRHNADGKLLLGSTEWIWLAAADQAFQARVDTGAATSSISAHDITIFERNGKDWARFFMSHPGMNDRIQIEAPLVRYVRVRQATADDLDRRPVVQLAVRIGELNEKAEFNLTDRSNMIFPVLLGRDFLKDIAVVDVARKTIQPKPMLRDIK